MRPLTGPAGNREFFLELEVPPGYLPAHPRPVQLPEEWSRRFGELAGA